MANWCWNTVQFNCSDQKLKQLQEFFAEMAAKEIKEQKGQLPAFFQTDRGYLFEISFENDFLCYETKWCPNVEVIKAIADHFEVGFILNYEELAMQVYGECVYNNGILSDIFLDNTDFAQYSINEKDGNTWVYEGGIYDTDLEILEILLLRKKALRADSCKRPSC